MLGYEGRWPCGRCSAKRRTNSRPSAQISARSSRGPLSRGPAKGLGQLPSCFRNAPRATVAHGADDLRHAPRPKVGNATLHKRPMSRTLNHHAPMRAQWPMYPSRYSSDNGASWYMVVLEDPRLPHGRVPRPAERLRAPRGCWGGGWVGGCGGGGLVRLCCEGEGRPWPRPRGGRLRKRYTSDPEVAAGHPEAADPANTQLSGYWPPTDSHPIGSLWIGSLPDTEPTRRGAHP